MIEQRKAVILLDDGVENRGKVINIIICSTTGILGLRMPRNQTLWDCTDFSVAIGDRFEDGIFTREGVPVEHIETSQDTIAALEQQLQSVVAQVAYIGMMTEVL